MSVFLLVWSPSIQTLSPFSLKFGKLIRVLLDSELFYLSPFYAVQRISIKFDKN